MQNGQLLKLYKDIKFYLYSLSDLRIDHCEMVFMRAKENKKKKKRR